MNKVLVTSLSIVGFFLSGMLFFLFYQRILTIHWRTAAPVKIINQKKQTRCIVHYFTSSWHQEARTIRYDQDVRSEYQAVLEAWLSVFSEEVLKKPITLESCSLSQNEHEIFISLSRSPFLKHWSTDQKIKTLQSLHKTLEPYNKTGLLYTRLFTHNKPLTDPQLDLTHGWPFTANTVEIKKNIETMPPIKRIVIEPFGGKGSEGRRICSSSERVITIKLAYQIKKELECELPHTVVTVIKNDVATEFERLSRISKAQPDLFLSLNAYQEHDDLHHLWLGFYGTDTKSRSLPIKEFVPFYTIHRYYLEENQSLITQLCNASTTHPYKDHVIMSAHRYPLSPLKGIPACAIMLELGISSLQDDKALMAYASSILKQAIKTLAHD